MVFVGQQHIQTLDIVTLKTKLNRNKGMYYIDSCLMIQQIVEKMKLDKAQIKDYDVESKNKTCAIF